MHATQTTHPKNTFDWQACLKSADGSTQMAKEILTMFLEELPHAKTCIQTAFKQNNHVALREEVHKLRGGCCYVGVPHLKEITAQLEQDLRNDKIDSVPSLVAQLEQAIADTTEAIKKSGVL